MKAIVQDRYGSADVLELRDIERPRIGEHDVLIRVRAAGVDRGVWHLMTGMPYLVRIMGYGLRRPKTPVPGMDVAGTVETVGSGVTDMKPGAAVFGTCRGAFAEFARARADRLIPMPGSLSFERAAAIPISGMTALEGVRDVGRIRPGLKVLVLGAAGGVGSFAVQIAKAFGAEVTGVCSTGKTELVRSIGADEVIDYTRRDFTEESQRYDLILDTGGNRPLARLRRALTPSGTLVIIGGEGGDRWIGGVGRQLKALLLSPFLKQRLRPMLAGESRENLRFLAELVESGRVKPVIDRTYSLAEAPEAIRRLEAGLARGKLVIRVEAASA